MRGRPAGGPAAAGPGAHAAPQGAPRRWRALAALVVSLLVVVLDNTVLNVALKTIQDDLGATQGELVWAINAYSLVFAALLFTWGVLGDRYGRRRILVLGLVLFATASLLCAFAQTPTQLIGARALLGIGGASVLPVTLSIITVIFPPQERGRAIGIWAAAVGGAVAIGPLLGGFLLEHFWWGSVFLINVPIVAAGVVGILMNVPESRNPHPGRLDPIGLVLSVLGLLALVYGIQEAGWGEPSTYVWIGVGVLVLVGFLFWEARTDHPSMDLSLFRIRSFSVPLAGTGLTFAALQGTLLFLAFYYQVVRGWSPLQSGALTLPFAVGQLLAAPRSGAMVARFGARRVIPFGLTLASLGMFLFTRLTPTTPVWLLLVIPFIFGFGMGNVIAPATTRMTLATPQARSGAGGAVQNTVRQVAATLGVAIISSIVGTLYTRQMTTSLADTPLPEPLRGIASDSIGATFEVAGQLQTSGQATAAQADALRQAGIDAYMPSFQAAALIGVGLLLLALALFLLFLPAQAEAVAWQEHGQDEQPRTADDLGADVEPVAAADAVHLVTEDDAHLSHVEDAPLERSQADAAVATTGEVSGPAGGGARPAADGATARVTAPRRGQRRFCVIQCGAEAHDGRGVEQHRVGATHASGPVRLGGEELAQDDREVVLSRLAVLSDDAVLVVQVGDHHHPRTVRPRDEPVAADAALVGEIGEVLGVVQHRGGVRVGTDPQDLATASDEAVERGPGTVVVVPAEPVEELVGKSSPRGEATLRVVVHDGPGRRAEHLGEGADLGQHGRPQVVEGLGVGEQPETLLLRAAVDPVPVVDRSQDHHGRALGSDGVVQRGHHPGGSSVHRSDPAQRRVDHEQVAAAHAQGVQIGDEGRHAGHPVSVAQRGPVRGGCRNCGRGSTGRLRERSVACGACRS